MKRILIIGDDNSLQSQMAEGYLNFYGNKFAEFSSAGLKKCKKLFPGLVRSMAEDGLDLDGAGPKLWSDLPSIKWDMIILTSDIRKKDLPSGLKTRELVKLDLPEPKSKKDGSITGKALEKLREKVKVECLKFIGQHFLVENVEQ